MPKLSFLLFLFFISLPLSFAQDEYLDAEAWAFLTNANGAFELAFSDATRGVTAIQAQQYVLNLTQLYGLTSTLENALRQRQSQIQQTGQEVPLDLVYLVTSLGALGSGLSSLTDYYQQIQSPLANAGSLQNSLRIAQLNNTIYWLSRTMYFDKAGQ